MEEIESVRATFDGKAVELVANGWFVDKAIRRCALPGFKQGRHVLEMSLIHI